MKATYLLLFYELFSIFDSSAVTRVPIDMGHSSSMFKEDETTQKHKKDLNRIQNQKFVLMTYLL